MAAAAAAVRFALLNPTPSSPSLAHPSHKNTPRARTRTRIYLSHDVSQWAITRVVRKGRGQREKYLVPRNFRKTIKQLFNITPVVGDHSGGEMKYKKKYKIKKNPQFKQFLINDPANFQ